MDKYADFPPDPEQPDWVQGWAVLRANKFFLGLFREEAQAEDFANKSGNGHSRHFGSFKLGTKDEFVEKTS